MLPVLSQHLFNVFGRLMWFMIKVTLGEHNRCNKTHRPETRFVVEVVAKNFTYATFKDDIALLKLNQRVEISDTIKPVCLPHNDGKYDIKF